MSAANASTQPARRVVITGMGAITPIGQTVETFWKACLAGCSGVGDITYFDAQHHTTRFAAEVKDWDPAPYMDRKEARRMATFVQFGVKAACMAAQDANLPINDDTRDRIGVYIGSGIGGLNILEAQHQILLEKGPSRVSPFTIPGIICNMSAGMVSIVLGVRGPNACISTACTTGSNNIGEAYHIIRRGDADAMLAGGAEATITPLAMAGFCQARSLSQRNDDPEHASRPFDANRDGFVMGEGSGVLVLEELETARARGARIYAEMVGYGASGDAYHITGQPADANGAIRSMQAALKSAQMQPTDIDYINAHGTSTELNDRNETLAIKAVLGDHAYKTPISSTKSMTGHLLGAAGAVEAIACALTLRDQIIHPTMNYETPDPLCDLDYVPNQPRKADVGVTMSNSFGFGGHNATLIIKRYAE